MQLSYAIEWGTNRLPLVQRTLLAVSWETAFLLYPATAHFVKCSYSKTSSIPVFRAVSIAISCPAAACAVAVAVGGGTAAG